MLFDAAWRVALQLPCPVPSRFVRTCGLYLFRSLTSEDGRCRIRNQSETVLEFQGTVHDGNVFCVLLLLCAGFTRLGSGAAGVAVAPHPHIWLNLNTYEA